MSMPFFICAAMTSVSAIISLGFSIASILNQTGQTRTPAFYACARSIAFAVISLFPFFNRSTPWLEASACGMIIVQALDAVIGVTLRDTMKTLGPAGTAIANLAALIWLMTQG
jgi:hypothetical protein